MTGDTFWRDYRRLLRAHPLTTIMATISMLVQIPGLAWRYWRDERAAEAMNAEAE